MKKDSKDKKVKKNKTKITFADIRKKVMKEYFSPLGLSVPAKMEVLKGTAIVTCSMIACSAFVAGVDAATAFVVSRL